MKRKTIRIILACTILLPVWIFELVALVVFAGFLCCGIGFFVMLGASIEFIATEDKEKCIEKFNSGGWLFFFPFFAPYLDAKKYIDTGKLL